MFFVRGLTSKCKAVFVNPDQVLYVCSAARERSILAFTHNNRLIVDQSAETVSQLFEEYLKQINRTQSYDDAGSGEPDSGRTYLKSN
jgi:hypothetical protein